MRIISGSLGGRSLRAAPGANTRPAMARTREALFSILESKGIVWRGLKALDLYAGTGSLAFESLSRGAAFASLVENGRDAVQCLTRNIQDLGLENRCRVHVEDVARYLRSSSPFAPFGLVFIDPPYRRGATQKSLRALLKPGWLAKGAFVTAEIEKDAPLTETEELNLVAERAFGQTLLKIWLYVGASNSSSEAIPLLTEDSDENSSISRNI